MYIKLLKDDKSLIKHVINLMTISKKRENRIPELLDDNELKEEFFNYGKLSGIKRIQLKYFQNYQI